MDAGLPGTVGLARRMLLELPRGRQIQAGDVNLARFVHHTLEAARALDNEDEGADIERLFAVIDLLAGRNTHMLAPFVERWRHELDGREPSDAQLSTRSLLNSILQAANATPKSSMTPARSSFSLADDFVNAVRAISHPSDSASAFSRIKAAMIGLVPSLLAIPDSADLSYLVPILTLAGDGTVSTVATLNYDRVVEEAAHLRGLALSAGGYGDSGEWVWPADVATHLIKLHGSVDLVWLDKNEPDQLPVKQAVNVELVPEWGRGQPAIVFGEGNKLQVEGPFLELLVEFTARLGRSDRLLVIGYSYRDEHVNQTIARWFNASPGRRIVHVGDLPYWTATGPAQFVGGLRHVQQRFTEIPGRARDGIEEAVRAMRS